MKVIYGVIAILVILSILNTWLPYDDTDNIEAKQRSGLILYTDHKTGCQYLQAGLFGGITPRWQADGAQMGCRH